MKPEELAHAQVLTGLSDKLLAMPDAMFLAVIGQLTPLSAVPQIAKVFDLIRPRLRQLRPPRPLTLTRLLCRPFEDLLTDSADLGAAGVPRVAIAPCWALIKAAMPAEVEALERRRLDTPPSKLEAVEGLAEQLWALAATALASRSSEILIGQPRLLPLMRDVFGVATAIETFKRALPQKPFGPLDERERAKILEIASDLYDRTLPLAAFLLAVGSRATSPASLIDLARSAQLPVPPELDVFAVASIEARAGRFEQSIATGAPEDLAREADTMLSAALEMSAAIGSDARQGLDRSTTRIKEAVRSALTTRVIEPAREALAAALEDNPSKSALMAAESHARALRRSRRAARSVGIGDKADATISAMRECFEALLDDSLKQSGGGGRHLLDSDEPSPAFRAIRMIELLAGAEAARPLLQAAMRANSR